MEQYYFEWFSSYVLEPHRHFVGQIFGISLRYFLLTITNNIIHHIFHHSHGVVTLKHFPCYKTNGHASHKWPCNLLRYLANGYQKNWYLNSYETKMRGEPLLVLLELQVGDDYVGCGDDVQK